MENNFFNSIQVRIMGLLLILMIMIALASYASLNFEQIRFVNPYKPTISVMGEGEVLAVPNIGQFSFSVTAEASDAKSAQEASGTKINDILAYLKEQGIEDKDVKVQNYNLYPKWRYEERVCPANSYCPPGERVQDGFSVNQTVSVKVRDTNKASAVITGVGERGATDISNLNFTIDDVSVLETEAREKAIANAKEKAVALAKQLNVRIIRFTGYYEENSDTYMDSMMSRESNVSDFEGPSLPVGEQSTVVKVNLTYEVE
jgi:uncharacterized protein YggE